MSAEKLTAKYVTSAEKVLRELKQVEKDIIVSKESVKNVIAHATAYLADAKYYMAQRMFETSLTSIAYCEGLLDALKLIGAVKFEWPGNIENEK
ncbi:MAG: DUF357 domain-containing protein [Candidatus Bathyarchaeia archaeon]